jgi:hypothetical protein
MENYQDLPLDLFEKAEVNLDEKRAYRKTQFDGFSGWLDSFKKE